MIYTLLSLFSLCSISVSPYKSCTGTCEFVSQSGVIIIQWSVCAEQFVPFFIQDQQQKAFYTSGTCLQQLREV